MTLKKMEVVEDPEDQMSDSQRTLLASMLDLVILGKSTTLFKSQQIDDPELCDEDKRKIAEGLLFENPTAFLMRFGHCLKEDHLILMEKFKNDRNSYDLEFYVNQLKAQLTENARKKLVKNRRFEALKRLENGGKYFSEEEMHEREPLLYHQLVGQFLSEQEKIDRYKEANKEAIPSFSEFLMTHAKETALETRLREEIADEVADTSSDDEPPTAGTSTDPPRTTWGADWEDEEREKKWKERRKKIIKSKKRIISSQEKRLLLEEFKTHVHTKFLDGLDAEFDYSSVDGNPEYDCLQVRSQDEEEKYFDEETMDNTICTDTGIEDY